MTMRWLKMVAALFIGLIGLMFFLDNLFSLGVAHSVVSFVVTGEEQPFYRIMGPVMTPGWMTWAALFAIMGTELVVGVLGLAGALRMFRARKADAGVFAAAKSPAILGGIVGMLLWYGFFIVIGESYFNMWQTEIGLGSVEGAFRYGTVCAVLMFFLRWEND